MKRYRELTIERERSDYPRGLKHYRKDTITENSLFDFELIKYKFGALLKGRIYEEDNTRHKAESKETAREILRGIVFGLLYGNRDSENSEREIDAITRRYISLDEREQQEHSTSESKRQEETQKAQNED